MRKYFLFTLFFFFQFSKAQEFIQIETNKVMCLMHFMETASEARVTSPSYTKYILGNCPDSIVLKDKIDLYRRLNLEYSANRDGFPKERHIYLNSKDLLWTAASYSTDLDDFNERIIGYLPHETHVQFIKILKDIEPIYMDFIWNPEQKNIKWMESRLAEHREGIEETFLAISRFYGTKWDRSIPFKIALCPIPLSRGGTTAIPKGNALICSYLLHREDEYKSTLGIVIHEMCHILYGEQSIGMQNVGEEWLSNANAPYNRFVGNFLDEGLATALGNGWAYEHINGHKDSSEWYNHKYINGFAHALFPLCKKYIQEEKTMDEAFIHQAVSLFENTYPDALQDLGILLFGVTIFANTEDGEEIGKIQRDYFRHFDTRSMEMLTPIDGAESAEYMNKKQQSKLFFIHSRHQEMHRFLKNQYVALPDELPMNSIFPIFDEMTQSAVFVFNLDSLDILDSALGALSDKGNIEFGQVIKF